VDQQSTRRTGLAASMREWMKGRKRPWTAATLCDGLGLEDRERRQKIYEALNDFRKRCEITHYAPQRKRRQNNDCRKYRYNHAWRAASKGTVKSKVLKSIYVSNSFTAADIERLSDSKRGHVNNTIRALLEAEYLIIVGQLPGGGNRYHVADRIKYRMEVM